jgi:hypothetical protein
MLRTLQRSCAHERARDMDAVVRLCLDQLDQVGTVNCRS